MATPRRVGENLPIHDEATPVPPFAFQRRLPVLAVLAVGIGAGSAAALAWTNPTPEEYRAHAGEQLVAFASREFCDEKGLPMVLRLWIRDCPGLIASQQSTLAELSGSLHHPLELCRRQYLHHTHRWTGVAPRFCHPSCRSGDAGCRWPVCTAADRDLRRRVGVSGAMGELKAWLPRSLLHLPPKGTILAIRADGLTAMRLRWEGDRLLRPEPLPGHQILLHAPRAAEGSGSSRASR